MAPTLNYLLDRTTSRQWRGFLAALAEEFQTQLGADELRQLMARIGQRFGATHQLPPCESTAQLAEAFNLIWHDSDWGFVELIEEADGLRIIHYCAPLTAFGPSALAWTPGFLQGVYEHWLSELGAEGLSVQQTSEFDDHAAIEFRLGRN